MFNIIAIHVIFDKYRHRRRVNVNFNVLSQFIMLAANSKLCQNAAVKNPQLGAIQGSIFAACGTDKKLTKEEMEKQFSNMDNELSLLQIFSAIPMLAPYVSPRIADLNESRNALQLVYDNFEGFAGYDDVIDESDIDKIREAAKYDGNEFDFSEDDLKDMYYLNDMEYDPLKNFSLSNLSFDNIIGNEHKNQNREFDDDDSDKNICINDDRDDDTYTVSEDVKEANLVFTKLNYGDELNLDGTWSFVEINDADNNESYVRYINKDTGTNVLVKGKYDDINDLVNVENEETHWRTDFGNSYRNPI